MPRRHAKKRPHRRPKRAGRRRSYVNKVPRGVGPVAPRLLTTMKYNEELSFTSILSGSMDQYQMRLNSLFDPNYTGTGHQPFGFDQLTALYSRYRVYKCKWQITAEANDRFQMAVLPVNGAQTFSSASLASEYPHSMTKMYSIGGSAIVFRGACYLPRLGGDKRAEYRSDDRFQAQIGASPTEVMNLHIVANNTATGTIALAFNITLIFYAELFDPFPLSQS